VPSRLLSNRSREIRGLDERDLKKMVTNFGIGTVEDLKRVTRPRKFGYIDLMGDGARRKIAEQGGH
jgi:Mrp family chromosome partitioning ATPase